jgi:hypothetical protein
MTDPARSLATPDPRTSSRIESPADRPPPLSGGPKTTVEQRARPAGCHLRATREGDARATDPARFSATRRPCTSYRSRSLVRRPRKPLADPKTGFRLEGSVRERPPSNHLLGWRSGNEPVAIRRDTGTTHIVSLWTRSPSPRTVGRPEDRISARSSGLRSAATEPPEGGAILAGTRCDPL